MKTSELHEELHKYVDSADSETLKHVQEAIASYKLIKGDDKVKTMAPWRTSLKPMTESQFFSMINEAEQNISEGNIYAQAEVELMMKKRHAKVYRQLAIKGLATTYRN